MEKRLKIYLCDFFHNYLGASTSVFPLNIGYLAAFANKFFAEDIEIELFKYPDEFIKKIKEVPPDLVGFSNYAWSADLNKKVSNLVKSINPKAVIVFGGPNINYSELGYQRFFTEHPAVDFYILYQGEIAFNNVLKEVLDKGLNMSALKSKPIDGVVFRDQNNIIIQGKPIPRIKDLNTIPSPYLTGLLDKFFDNNLIPIIEMSRGCPYQCTYCCQGFSSHSQIEFFDLERVKKELDYVARRVKKTNILMFADSNFGILARDIEVAKYIAELMKETGYPRRVMMNWAKNQPKIFEIAKILKNINLVISLQSLDEQVLKNIKRQNMDLAVFRDIISRVNQAGGMSGTEIIMALPGETKESHLKTIRQLFDWNVSFIICYNFLILEGSEIALAREKGEFQCQSKFRVVDNSFGEYDGKKVFETEEGVRQTADMSEEDILYFRPVHWLIQFLWNYRFYYDLLKYLQSLKINPLDFITQLIDGVSAADTPEKVKKIFQEFKEEAKAEWFNSPEELERYYSEPERFKWLAEGNYGKMNSQYAFKVLLTAKEDFEKYLYQTASKLPAIDDNKKEILKDLLSFHSARIIDFTQDWQATEREKTISLNYDILGWQNAQYQENLEKFILPEEKNFLFYLPADQTKSLAILLKQYEHKNKNVTLRKMSEYMDIRDFFYQVK